MPKRSAISFAVSSARMKASKNPMRISRGICGYHRQRVVAGDSDQQVIDWMVARYSNSSVCAHRST